jgi:DNA polymerase-3 subunit alpha
VQAFQGYGFNKGHASSYGVLATKMAWLKCHHPAEYYAALLDVFPERSSYIASARGKGFEFLPPDVNRSTYGFGIDKMIHNGIRVGLTKIKGLGPVAVDEIIREQPFTDYEDFKSKTTRRALNAPKLELMGQLGALESLGVVKKR